MANNTLPSPATIEGINTVWRGDGRVGVVWGGRVRWREGHRGEAEGRPSGNINICGVLSDDITEPPVAILEVTGKTSIISPVLT